MLLFLRWFHLAVVWDGSVMKIYLNGEVQQTLQGSIKNFDEQIQPRENKMYLGRLTNMAPKYGKFAIDEWYYWNTKLSDKEIRKIYALDQ